MGKLTRVNRKMDGAEYKGILAGNMLEAKNYVELAQGSSFSTITNKKCPP